MEPNEPMYINIQGPDMAHGDALLKMNKVGAAWLAWKMGEAAAGGGPVIIKPYASDNEAYDLHIIIDDDVENWPEPWYPGYETRESETH